MKITWDSGDSWFDRSYAVENSDGENIREFQDQPTLDELRKIERQHGEATERLDLWQSGLLCTSCNTEINDRFAATTKGDLCCWDCAMDRESTDQQGITINTDPTKSVMSESQLHKKSLCDHVINVATGCRHGCEFCYVPTTPAIDNRKEMLAEQANIDDPQADWGKYLLYRDDLPERLARVLKKRDPEARKQTRRGRGIVMLSSGTDCYQDRRTAQISRGVIIELIKHGIPVRVLTRSPAVARDVDLFQKAGERIAVGSSIPSFEAPLVRAIEPGAPSPMTRWGALDDLQQEGIPVYVSMSPTYPLMDEDDFHELLSYFRALGEIVVFHEPINPRGSNFQQCLEAVEKAGYDDVATEFRKMRDNHQYWVEYAIEQIRTVQRVATRFDGLEVHSWPDNQLIRTTSGQLRSRLRDMQQAVSPESFSGHTPEKSPAQSAIELKTGSTYD
ncbi:radical SAM protein [Halobacteria archaeon AArc-m2/3/4]|uniref:Radical SAM protein n=1 Tax=Natronoglomus mannanivorans TaxID=2979990 RepID=A0ABT2QLY3_9EURY|nr:radical SAM protein [Halobacteria archaeon AArc-m2/3/4]